MRLDLLLGTRVELAISNGSRARRAQMLGQVTDLFVAGANQCTDEQIAIFDHIITRLAVDIEISARALLATRLAPIPNAPPKVVRNLAFDDVIEVAGPVLSQSKRLDDATLVEAAHSKSQEHLLAISRRSQLGEAVTDALVERGDQRVAYSIAENRGAKFSEHGLSRLIFRSEGDDDLAVRVGARTDISPQLFLVLLEKASQLVRAKLEAMHPHLNSEVRIIVAEVANRIRGEALGASHDSVLARVSTMDERKLASLASQGLLEEVADSLAMISKLPIDVVRSALKDGNMETIIVLARALDFSWSTVESISLAASGKRLSTLKLEQYHESFKRLKPTTAQEIVRFYRTRNTLVPKTMNA